MTRTLIDTVDAVSTRGTRIMAIRRGCVAWSAHTGSVLRIALATVSAQLAARLAAVGAKSTWLTWSVALKSFPACKSKFIFH